MQDSLNILLPEISEPDFIEHHGVKGMRWGVRKQKQLSNIQRREDKNKKNLTGRTYSSLTKLKNNLLKQNKNMKINNIESQNRMLTAKGILK